MAIYEQLSATISEQMSTDKANGVKNPYACAGDAIRRRPNPHDEANVWRTSFIRDIDKILNCPFYNRYADKTQVFSLYKNDDITHRALHVQLVSRIARTIGNALGLNLDLIEAIALGHDIGHTPFGHTGERILDSLFSQYASKRFNHNIHSVRVLDEVFPLNVSLQTLNGIASHNGELELSEYKPIAMTSFYEFDKQIGECYTNSDHVKKLVPSTLEGCVMRISDIIAYLGKDRQDAIRGNLDVEFENTGIGTSHAEISNNLIVNIIECSYGKDFIRMDENHFDALKKAKRDNYDVIYGNETVTESDDIIRQMMSKIYAKLLFDLKNSITSSPIFDHHIDYVCKPYYDKNRIVPYLEYEPNFIVVDYIASMTDDYFVDLFKHLFPSSTLSLKYKGYFDN